MRPPSRRTVTRCGSAFSGPAAHPATFRTRTPDRAIAAAAGRVRRLFLDTAPLRRDRDYRWLWSGQVVNGIGNQITRIALPYQVYVLTGSTLAIAALTLFQLVPILLFALGAGSLADAVDRRRLLLATQAGLAACSLALVLLALRGRRRSRPCSRSRSWPPGLVVGRPAGAVVVHPAPRPARALPAAIALNQLNFQMASIVGPAVGGILIATVGLAGAYAVDLVSFIASFVALLAIQPLPPLGVVVAARARGDPRGPAFRAVSAGRSWARSSSTSTR